MIWGPPTRSPLAVLGVVLVLAAALLAGAPPATADPGDAGDGARLLVTRDADAPDLAQVAHLRRTPGIVATRALDRQAQVIAVTVDAGADPAAVRGALARLPGVAAVEDDVVREFHAVPDDRSYDLQWAHRATRAEAAWAHHTGGGREGETRPLIGIIDSGIDATHPDLDGQIEASFQVVEGRVVPGTRDNDGCGIGHGTLTAGVAAATGDNGIGVAGVAWNARIIDVAVTNTAAMGGREDCSGPNDVDTIAAMAHLVDMDDPPQVINLSLGASSDSCPTSYQAVIDRARERGIVVVSSAGNRPGAKPSIPASCDGVISVGAVDRAEVRTSYSPRNPYLDLVAPGGEVDNCPEDFAELAAQAVATTSYVDERLYNFSFTCKPTLSDPNGDRLEAQVGTSFSTPQVAAGIGLLQALATDRGTPLSPDQLEALVEQTARDLGAPGRDDEHGWGTLDLGAAVQRLIDGDVPDAPEPDPAFPVEAAAPDPIRIVGGDPAGVTTDPISQAVALSGHALPGGATPFAVLARADDFADALAGPSIGLGVGPLLLTSSTGPLDHRTRDELNRVLGNPRGATTVYVMGGPDAVPEVAAEQIRADGHLVVRVAGAGREETSVQASQLVQTLRESVQNITVRDWVLVASGDDFADALTGGQLAARFGIPTLVTSSARLHPAVAEEIRRTEPQRVIVLGGPAAIDDATFDEIKALGFPAERLAGETRVETALEIHRVLREEMQADGPAPVDASIAVNVRASFVEALTASLLSGSRGHGFLPVDGLDGGRITDGTAGRFCGVGGDLLVIGGRDRVDDALADALADVVAGNDCTPAG